MAERRKRGTSTLPPELRSRLDAARRALLEVHKALLDHERRRHEKLWGRVESSGAFLQVVIHDPAFAWLRTLSELVVRMDELLESDEPDAPQEAEAALAGARSLLTADAQGEDFQRNYQRALQESPEVGVAHGNWRKVSGAPG